MVGGADHAVADRSTRLGAALAGIRRCAGLTQIEAGAVIGISGQAWGKYETGKAPTLFHPSRQRLLEKALGLEAGAIAELQRGVDLSLSAKHQVDAPPIEILHEGGQDYRVIIRLPPALYAPEARFTVTFERGGDA